MRREVVPRPTDANAGARLVQLDCGHELLVDAIHGSHGDCTACDRRLIPQNTTIGRRTPTFDHRSVPPALLGEHRTNAWAELVVLDGSVGFEEKDPPWTATAIPGRPVVIVPRRDHRITPDADARFHVQFHDLPPAMRDHRPEP